MNREAVFLEELEAELRRQLEEPVMLRIHRIPRNNGGESLCLTILPPGRRSSPAVPLEPYFFRWSQGQSPGELVRELLGEWRRADRGRELEKLAFGDYQQVKDGCEPGEKPEAAGGTALAALSGLGAGLLLPA